MHVGTMDMQILLPFSCQKLFDEYKVISNILTGAPLLWCCLLKPPVVMEVSSYILFRYLITKL